MIVAPLCSGSTANSTFIGTKSNGILIDVGCSYKRLREYLCFCNIELSAIKAVLLTHEHSDHVKGLLQFTKHNNIPVFASSGTCNAILAHGLVYNPDRLFALDRLGELESDYFVEAFNTPHDSAQSTGFVITSQNEYKVAYLTDLGEITPEVESATLGANLAFIESNYDVELLRKNTSYPAFTKDRIRSRYGHLSNTDSADYIQKLVENGATRIMLAHLSRENNTPQIAFTHTVNRLSAAGLRHNYDYTLDIAGVQTVGEYMAV